MKTWFELSLSSLSKTKVKAYSESSQTSKIELFAKIFNGFHPLTVSAKNSTLVAWLGSVCVST